MYMSRLAAQKEFLFMKALGENGFSVPKAIAQSRHTVVMEMVDGVPLRSVQRVGDPAGLYAELMEVILRLARFGLIHGDFNEFNIMVRDEDDEEEEEEEKEEEGEGEDQAEKAKQENENENGTEADDDEEEEDTDVKATARIKPVVIDFPQMVSIDHANAEMYFDRDVNCIKTFFKRRFGFTSEQPGPFFAEAKKRVGMRIAKRLDVEVEASGFSKKMAKELEKYMREVGVDGDGIHGEHDRDERDYLGEAEKNEADNDEDESRSDASLTNGKHDENPSSSIQGLTALSIDNG